MSYTRFDIVLVMSIAAVCMFAGFQAGRAAVLNDIVFVNDSK